MKKALFKHERWLSGKYKVGIIDYQQQQVIYKRSHSDGAYGGLGAAVKGEKGYRKLAELLLELAAAKIGRTPLH